MDFYMPTKVCQEKNAVKNHGAEIASFGKKALIVTGKSSSKKNHSLQDVIDVLNENATEYVVFDEVPQNPSVELIMKASEFGRNEGADFVIGIGGDLKSGKPHDGRAPDYDDWSLNGDILFYHEALDCVLEVSSMGIRVDSVSLDRQLRLSGCDDRRNREFHKMLLNNELPLTIGGGIGQSRLCMLLLGKAHIGEVQSSVWDSFTEEACKHAGVSLL